MVVVQGTTLHFHINLEDSRTHLTNTPRGRRPDSEGRAHDASSFQPWIGALDAGSCLDHKRVCNSARVVVFVSVCCVWACVVMSLFGM